MKKEKRIEFIEKSNYEKLVEEFKCAITAILGSQCDEAYKKGNIDIYDLKAIVNKVAFYLDLNERVEIKKGEEK